MEEKCCEFRRCDCIIMRSWLGNARLLHKVVANYETKSEMRTKKRGNFDHRRKCKKWTEQKKKSLFWMHFLLSQL